MCVLCMYDVFTVCLYVCTECEVWKLLTAGPSTQISPVLRLDFSPLTTHRQGHPSHTAKQIVDINQPATCYQCQDNMEVVVAVPTELCLSATAALVPSFLPNEMTFLQNSTKKMKWIMINEISRQISWHSLQLGLSQSCPSTGANDLVTILQVM